VSTESRQPALEALREALDVLLAQSSAPDRLLDLLSHLDAGRAAGVVHDLARPCRQVAQSVAPGTREGAASSAHSTELAAACEAFVRSHASEDQSRSELGHIGWADVISDSTRLRDRYGFTSRHSIATFEELLRYVSAACGSLTRVLVASRELVVALHEPAREPAKREWDTLARSISENIVLWTKTRDVVDRAAEAVREVLTRTEDFDVQREALAERSKVERDDSVARLLSSISKVLSPWAWLVRSPESRLTCLEPACDYRLRLGFADGLFREVELGPEYWSTTGLEIDPESFRSARIDRLRNRLVWSNGFEDSGERLHLAILEGRLPGRTIDPIGAYEIIPGRSVGPFELGMTREQIEEGSKVRPMLRLKQGSSFFPLIDVSEAELASWGDSTHPGVIVSYDASGRCCRIVSVFSWSVEPPIFTLLGQLVNGMSLEASTALLRTIASDVRWVYGGVESASAGVSAGVYEASDETIMSVTVRPRENDV
jgi:hypothetical protein